MKKLFNLSIKNSQNICTLFLYETEKPNYTRDVLSKQGAAERKVAEKKYYKEAMDLAGEVLDTDTKNEIREKVKDGFNFNQNETLFVQLANFFGEDYSTEVGYHKQPKTYYVLGLLQKQKGIRVDRPATLADKTLIRKDNKLVLKDKSGSGSEIDLETATATETATVATAVSPTETNMQEVEEEVKIEEEAKEVKIEVEVEESEPTNTAKITEENALLNYYQEFEEKNEIEDLTDLKYLGEILKMLEGKPEDVMGYQDILKEANNKLKLLANKEETIVDLTKLQGELSPILDDLKKKQDLCKSFKNVIDNKGWSIEYDNDDWINFENGRIDVNRNGVFWDTSLEKGDGMNFGGFSKADAYKILRENKEYFKNEGKIIQKDTPDVIVENSRKNAEETFDGQVYQELKEQGFKEKTETEQKDLIEKVRLEKFAEKIKNEQNVSAFADVITRFSSLAEKNSEIDNSTKESLELAKAKLDLVQKIQTKITEIGAEKIEWWDDDFINIDKFSGELQVNINHNVLDEEIMTTDEMKSLGFNNYKEIEKLLKANKDFLKIGTTPQADIGEYFPEKAMIETYEKDRKKSALDVNFTNDMESYMQTLDNNGKNQLMQEAFSVITNGEVENQKKLAIQNSAFQTFSTLISCLDQLVNNDGGGWFLSSFKTSMGDLFTKNVDKTRDGIRLFLANQEKISQEIQNGKTFDEACKKVFGDKTPLLDIQNFLITLDSDEFQKTANEENMRRIVPDSNSTSELLKSLSSKGSNGFGLEGIKKVEDLNKFKLVIAKFLGDRTQTGGYYEESENVMMGVLAGKFAKVEKENFDEKLTTKNILIGGEYQPIKVLPSLYEKAIKETKAHMKFDKMVNETTKKYKEQGISKNSATIRAEVQSYINSVILETYGKKRNFKIATYINDNNLEGNLFGKRNETMREIWQEYKISDGVGMNLDAESWDTIMQELAVNAPLIIVSGGVGNAVAAGARTAVYGVRAGQTASRAMRIGSRIGKMGKIGKGSLKLGKNMGYLGREGSLLLVEGAIFEATHTLLAGGFAEMGIGLEDSKFQYVAETLKGYGWAERIISSSLMLGAFKIPHKLMPYLGKSKLLAKVTKLKKTKPKLGKSIEYILMKGTDNALGIATLMLTGAAQQGYYSMQEDGEFGAAFWEALKSNKEWMHALMVHGSLKASGSVIKATPILNGLTKFTQNQQAKIKVLGKKIQHQQEYARENKGKTAKEIRRNAKENASGIEGETNIQMKMEQALQKEKLEENQEIDKEIRKEEQKFEEKNKNIETFYKNNKNKKITTAEKTTIKENSRKEHSVKITELKKVMEMNNAKKEAIKNAHKTGIIEVDGTFSNKDLIAKRDILLAAEFTKAEAFYLMRKGYCGNFGKKTGEILQKIFDFTTNKVKKAGEDFKKVTKKVGDEVGKFANSEKERKKSLEQERIKLKEEGKKLESDLKNMIKEIKKLENSETAKKDKKFSEEISELKAKGSEKINELKTEITNLDKEITNLKNQKNDESKIPKTHKKYFELNKEINELEKKTDKTKLDKKLLENKKIALEEVLQKKNKELKVLQKSQKILEKNQEIDGQIREKNKSLKTKKEEIKNLKDIKKKLDSKEIEYENFKNENQEFFRNYESLVKLKKGLEQINKDYAEKAIEIEKDFRKAINNIVEIPNRWKGGIYNPFNYWTPSGIGWGGIKGRGRRTRQRTQSFNNRIEESMEKYNNKYEKGKKLSNKFYVPFYGLMNRILNKVHRSWGLPMMSNRMLSNNIERLEKKLRKNKLPNPNQSIKDLKEKFGDNLTADKIKDPKTRYNFIIDQQLGKLAESKNVIIDNILNLKSEEINNKLGINDKSSKKLTKEMLEIWAKKNNYMYKKNGIDVTWQVYEGRKNLKEEFNKQLKIKIEEVLKKLEYNELPPMDAGMVANFFVQGDKAGFKKATEAFNEAQKKSLIFELNEQLTELKNTYLKETLKTENEKIREKLVENFIEVEEAKIRKKIENIDKKIANIENSTKRKKINTVESLEKRKEKLVKILNNIEVQLKAKIEKIEKMDDLLTTNPNEIMIDKWQAKLKAMKGKKETGTKNSSLEEWIEGADKLFSEIKKGITRQEIEINDKEYKLWEDIIDKFKNPKRWKNAPVGSILSGPNRTGKSLRIRMIRGMFGKDAFCLQIDAGKIATGTWGSVRGKLNEIRDNVLELRKNNPKKPIFVFLDEADGIIGYEKNSTGGNASAEFNERLTLLKEIFGNEGERGLNKKGIHFMLASNKPQNIPEQLKNAGRFEILIPVLPPTTINGQLKAFSAVFNQDPEFKTNLAENNINIAKTAKKLIEEYLEKIKIIPPGEYETMRKNIEDKLQESEFSQTNFDKFIKEQFEANIRNVNEDYKKMIYEAIKHIKGVNYDIEKLFKDYDINPNEYKNAGFDIEH